MGPIVKKEKDPQAHMKNHKKGESESWPEERSAAAVPFSFILSFPLKRPLRGQGKDKERKGKRSSGEHEDLTFFSFTNCD